MAEVLITFKVMPDGEETELDGIIRGIKGLRDFTLNTIEEEPIAFGLVAIKPSFIVEDAEGVVDALELALRNLKGVGEVEVTEVTLL
ncbi:MAG: elongation factor 1-beta [Candidatus Hydrothermarchaeales archaeon]